MQAMKLETVVNESWLQQIAEALPGADLSIKPEWGAWILSVGGKQFGQYGNDNLGRPILTVKGDPFENLALRQEFSEIVPGYYSNKKHWNSVLLEAATFSEVRLRELVEESYRLVLSTLTKKLQSELSV